MKTPRELAFEAGVEWIERIDAVPANAVDAMRRQIAYRYSAMPLGLVDKTLRVALSDPFNFDVIDGLCKELRYDVEPVLAPAGGIARAITRYYGEL